MNEYNIHSQITIEVRTIVEAFTEKEAIEIAKERYISICRHGTFDHDAQNEWVILDIGDNSSLKPYVND
tara:strand:+ start:426 stop:632 length:207 start_codon:yes stop_codon:yes gene_type:complete